MAVLDPRFTYNDLQAMPNDGKRYEILGGDLFVSPAPKTRHQAIVHRLQVALDWAPEHGYGQVYAAPVDVYLDEHTVFQPDVLFVAQNHLDRITEDNIQGPPDLVIEVLSESTRKVDLGQKLRAYARYKVPLYWAVDPDGEKVFVYEAAGGFYPAQPRMLDAQDDLTTPLLGELRILIGHLLRP